MKTSYFIIVIMGIALAGLAAKIVLDGSSDKNNSSAEADSTAAAASAAIENILTRTSIRDYSDRQVSDELVDTLLQAAMAAPTARNARPWQFVVIRNRATLDTIASRCPNISMAAKAPLAIVVCGDLNIARDKGGDEYWQQDCSAATENLLLAANATGLGAVWCGIYPMPDRVDIISRLLELPEGVVPLNVIPVGYPKTEATPKNKYDTERIHLETFK